jgi:predicted AAA+ superfamily ATPase
MEKEIIKRLIAEKQEEIVSVKLVKRPIELEPSANYVLIGLRRAGKS